MSHTATIDIDVKDASVVVKAAQYVKQNLAELVQQMSQLPLVNGNVEDISAKLKKSIGG